MQAAQNRAAAAAREAQPPPPPPAKPEDDFIAARPVSPISAPYPQRAYEAGQHGYVVVEFMLNAKGRALDPHVVEAVPPRVFDDAALLAVRNGRFDTSPLAGSGTPRRARIRIAFK